MKMRTKFGVRAASAAEVKAKLAAKPSKPLAKRLSEYN
jgi:hypothetical protein